MPGWIIQGVRGEGKSLAAVAKIREYMLQGRPVATNLDLFLEHLLPADNETLAYRLPDRPRLVDFQALPPAYDPKYKGEDKNGLLVLDELGTWLNSRNWSEKTRLEMLNWLFLSRKDHWDVILLAQDHEMIDAQVRTTLCDYLVQASRLDRQKIPYLAGLLEFLGFNSFMPRVHRYHVFYGLSTSNAPIETWTFTGKNFYNGYDTNQRFRDGFEPLMGTLVDMRAMYSYIPANYLTNHVHVQRLQQRIAELQKKPIEGKSTMASKTTAKLSSAPQFKIILLVVALVGYFGYRTFSSGFSSPNDILAPHSDFMPTSAPVVKLTETKNGVTTEIKPMSAGVPAPAPANDQLTERYQYSGFVDYLLDHYRPRLSVSAFSPDTGFHGNVDFYDNGVMIESYSIRDLHAFGVVLIHRPYGADLLFKNKTYVVTSWLLHGDQS